MIDDSFRVRYKSVPVAISENATFFPTPPHNHTELEIIYIYHGSANVKISEHTFTANTGDLIFCNPLEVHSLTSDQNDPYLHRCICLDCALIGDELVAQKLQCGELAVPWHISRENSHNARLSRFFEEIYDAVAQDSETIVLEVPAYISLMAAYMLKNQVLRDNRYRQENTLFCDRVLRFISETYAGEVTSKQAAESLNFNQSYFCRAFRRHFGMTFSDYLNSYRINVAKQLLDEKKPIAEVALECGFNNPEYFSRAFKKYMGIVPTQYKKSIQCG